MNKQTVRLANGTEVLAAVVANGTDVQPIHFTTERNALCRANMLGAPWVVIKGDHRNLFFVAIAPETFTPAGHDCLYSFNFIGGGINSVIASTYREAIARASLEYRTLKPNPDTFRRLDTKSRVDNYYKSLPLMD